MPRIAVVTDSTADIPASAREKYEISVVPLVVNWEGNTYRDKIDLSTQEFFQRLRTTKALPKTGAPSLGAFEETYRGLLERADGVVSVHLSSKLSGTFGVAQAAAQSVDPSRITVIDSESVSVCIGWLVERAAEMGAEGAALPEITSTLQEMVPRLRAYFVIDTLEYLQKGGRIGRAAAFAGTLLNVKPILAIRDGEVQPVERVRTLSAATRRLVEVVKGLGPLERLSLVYGDNVENTDELMRQLQPHYPDLQIERGEIGAVLGTYSGPGLVGAGLLLAA